MAATKEYSCIRKTKRALAESLALLSREKPLNKITVKEVCAKADLSRNAFYTHYPDINGLLAEIEQNTLNRVSEILQEFVDGEFPQNMLISLQRLLDMFTAENKNIMLMLLENPNTSFMMNFKTMLGNFFFEYFRDFDSAGFEKTYHYFFVFIAEGMIGMLRLWFEDPKDMSKEMFSYMCYIMIRRLLPMEN